MAITRQADGGSSGRRRTTPVPKPAPTTPAPPATIPSTMKVVFIPPSTDVEIVNAVADSLQKQPPDLDQWFIDEVQWVAGFLRVLPRPPRPPPPVGGRPIPAGRQTTPLLVSSNRRPPPASPTVNPVNEITKAQCSQMLANIKALVEKVCDFASRAKNSGFSPPDNPFVVLAQMNASRGTSFDPFNITSEYASDLVFNIKVYIDLLDAENQGGINFNSQDPINVAQLGHVTLSFNGLGGSGNVAADIMSFLPSSDQVKQNIAEQELAVLDFTRRIPYLLFTLDYNQDGVSGVIVGWKKIPDASGYLIDRHSSFSQENIRTQIDNARIKNDTAMYLNYAKLNALCFLESFDDSAIQLYLDNSLRNDEYYIYTLQAYQERSVSDGKMFSGKSNAVQYNVATFIKIDEIIQQMDPGTRQIIGWIPAVAWNAQSTPIYKTFPSTISPWPAIAQYLSTDSMYDWILAATNIRASIIRKDDRETTRKYSYLNAQYDFLKSMAMQGKLVVPADISDFIANIENSIMQFGVTQTILEIFQETGITYYFDGRDPSDNGVFDRAGTGFTTTSMFHTIASAIDPDTATIDLKALAHNMSQLASNPGTSLNTNIKLETDNTSTVNAKPAELAVPDSDLSNDATADDAFQFISRLGKMDDSVVDLTTFDGISKLLRVVRIYSDFGPNKIKSVSVDQPPEPPKPPKPPEPKPKPEPVEVVPDEVTQDDNDVVRKDRKNPRETRRTVKDK